MDRKDSVIDMDEHKKIMLEYCVNEEEFEKTMNEFSTVMARVDMGGNEGIHKPDLRKPRPTSSVANPPAPFFWR
jgi:hypothetical protein